MNHAWRLLAASMFGLIAAAAGGCSSGEATAFKVYDPAAEAETAPAPVAGPAVAADTPQEQPVVAPAANATTADTTATAVENDTRSEPPPTALATAPDAAIVQPALAAAAQPEQAVATPGGVAPASAADTTDSLIAAVGSTDVAIAAVTGPRETKLLIPEKTFRAEGDALRVSYDDIDLLKVLNMEPVTADAPDRMPSWLKDLEGQRIRIRGYMRPGELSEELPFFVLARDTQACCFGPNTKSYDIIPTIMREGVTTDYIHMTPFDLVGVFHINVEMDLDDPEKVEFLYYIDDAVLIEK